MYITNRVEFTQLAADYKNVNLGQGFPDFSPPKFVQDAFCKAVTGGPAMHQYTRGFVSGNTHWFLSLGMPIFSSSKNNNYRTKGVTRRNGYKCLDISLLRATLHL